MQLLSRYTGAAQLSPAGRLGSRELIFTLTRAIVKSNSHTSFPSNLLMPSGRHGFYVKLVSIILHRLEKSC